MTLAADDVLTIDQAWSPTGVQAVAGEYDYRRARALADTQLDHTFTGLHFNDRAAARSTLLAVDGSGVSITWDSACRWVQVCTGDEATPQLNRRAVAIEPMTCPPGAFQTGNDLIRLTPRHTHTATWQIAAVLPPRETGVAGGARLATERGGS